MIQWKLPFWSFFSQGTNVSHFLPTSKRIVQFSDGKEPKVLFSLLFSFFLFPFSFFFWFFSIIYISVFLYIAHCAFYVFLCVLCYCILYFVLFFFFFLGYTKQFKSLDSPMIVWCMWMDLLIFFVIPFLVSLSEIRALHLYFLFPSDIGHIEFLKKAKDLGDYLLVGVIDDRVKSYCLIKKMIVEKN